MSPGDFVTMVALLVAGLLALLMLTSAYKRKLDLKQRELELQAQVEAAKCAGLAGSGDSQLEERVRILERIATDRGQDVAAQIEALRDQRRLDERFDRVG